MIRRKGFSEVEDSVVVVDVVVVVVEVGSRMLTLVLLSSWPRLLEATQV